MSDSVRVRVVAAQFRYDYAWHTEGDEIDVDPETLAQFPDRLERVEADTCEVVKGDGEVCGRPKPCRYHDDEEA